MAYLDFNKIELNKKIRMGLGISLLVLMISSVVSFYSIRKLIAQSELVDHTNEVRIDLIMTMSMMKDAETGIRGYLASGKEEYLEPYLGAYDKVILNYNNVRKRTADNPLQQAYLDTFKVAVENVFANLKSLQETYKATSKVSEVGLQEGKKLMDKCRRLVLTMRATEKELLAVRTIEADRYAFYSPIVIAVSSFFAVAVSMFSFYFISKDINNKAIIQKELNKHNYLLTGNTNLNDLLRGEKELIKSGNEILIFLCEFMKAQSGVLYVVGDDGRYHLHNTYAINASNKLAKSFLPGEGLVGQCAVQRKTILLDDIPGDSLRVESGLTSIEAVNILLVPFHYNGQTVAVIELANKKAFTKDDLDFIETVGDTISIFINGLKTELKTQNLLSETQSQAEELQAQQEELKQINEELEEQTQSLKQQQEELQIANEELEQQSQSIELKNRELERAKTEVEKKTKDLELSSKYKSEFLANMSHELRTPLNSLLILSKDLADNKKKNLEESQVDSANIIYNSGKDLLQLINEVLDLSKIEAGKMDLSVERIELSDFAEHLNRNFKHIASRKNIGFTISLAPDAPPFIHSDRQRLDQILRNLISNAIKFTHQGGITVMFRKNTPHTIAIDVVDTGIGIPEDKHALIFEAFQQAEGGTARKYGGTGLGLSISRELSKLIGGYVTLQSKVNEGSTFTLVIPLAISNEQDLSLKEPEKQAVRETESIKQVPLEIKEIPDDRNTITEKDKTILIIEDDESFARILLDQSRQRSFKGIVATTGEEGLLLAQRFHPKAIILDLMLPGMNGRTVLAELKANPALRHIPVHIISAKDRTMDVIKGGAVEYLRKPIDKDQLDEAFMRMENFINRKMKNLLIIEDDDNSRKSIKLLIGNGDVKCYEAATGADALRLMSEIDVDCVVLDLGLPDMNGFELIKKIGKRDDKRVPPIIVYTGKDLSKAENDELQMIAETIIIKGVKSEERLLDETALFLHRTIDNLPDEKKEIITELYNRDTIFHNKKVLLVDDDMRNIFALSRVLKESGMEITKAENGVKALEALNAQPNIDLVLMDIMMPEMDGYEAMRQIRKQERFKDLPILALTAKAMKEDRAKCIEAGANDYISKPIELERLLSLMRIWIKK